MGRLIDVDEYEKRIKPYDTEDAMDKALYNFAHDHLVTTPTAQPQWIPCSERLPEESDDYLCSYGALTGHFVGIDIYEAEKKEFGFYSDDEQGNEVWHPVTNVVAWMELPEPWREQS